jgi:hypothetical protein
VNFDHIFEDLEAEFESTRTRGEAPSPLLRCNSLRVYSAHVMPETLVAPIIGSDFVGGLGEEFDTWSLYPVSQILEIVPHTLGDIEMPRLRNFDRSLLELLDSFAKPIEIVCYLPSMAAAPNRGMLIGVDCGFLVVASARGTVAIASGSVAKISVGVVDNLSEEI